MHYDHQDRVPLQVENMSERFNYFQKLPAEIRTMIWEYSLPESRVYEVLDAPNSTQKTPAQQGLMFANVHPEPPPALAAVCRESRYFVLHHYKPLTLGKTTKYVDLSRDIMLLEPYLLVKRLHRTLNFMSQIPLMRDNINRLALGTSYGIYTGICHPVLNWKVSKTNVGKLLSSLAKFPRLNTLIFIVHQEFQFEFDFRYPHAGGSSFGTLTHDLPMPPLPRSAAPLHSPSSHHPATPFPQRPPANDPRNPPPSLPTGPGRLSALPPPHPTQPQPQRPPAQHHQLPAPSPPTAQPPAAAAQQPQPRPQQVHQAYRFKFDIEANINHAPRGRPHRNELLYYPLDYGADDDGLWWDLHDNNGSGTDDEGDGAGGEWCDPWPTNDDWRRFRRRLLRAVRAAVLGAAAAEGAGEEAQGGGWCAAARVGGGGGTAGYKAGGWAPWGPGVIPAGGGVAGEERGATRTADLGSRARGKMMRVPALEGASLLWRYTKGGYV